MRVARSTKSSLTTAAALVAGIALASFSRFPGALGLGATKVNVTFVSLVAESLPFLLAGAAIAGALRGAAGRALLRTITRFPRAAGVVAPLSGVALPLCDCGLLPLARDFRERGAPGSVINGFIAGAPLTNPIVIVSTLVAFPGKPAMVIGRVALGSLVGAIAAIFAPPAPQPKSAHDHHHDADGRRPLASIATELVRTGPTLVLGALAAAVVKTLLPVSAILAFESQPLVGAAALMALAFVMSICSQADAFVAATLPGGDLPRLAFLVLGPMFDIRLAVLYRREFGSRWLAGYGAVVVPSVLVLTVAWGTWVLR